MLARRGAGYATRGRTPKIRAFNEAHQLSDGSLVEDVEGFFFLCGLRMVLGWLELARQRFPAVKSAIDDFKASVPHAIDLRNMRVHEDEYLAGTGKKQSDYFHDFDSLFETSAHSIVVRGDDYLLGGRVSVPGTLAALRKLQPAIDAAPR